MYKKIILQVFFWATILILNIAFMAWDSKSGFLEVLTVATYAIVFYFNILYLFPKLYKSHRLQYFLSGIILMAAALLFIEFLGELFFPEYNNRRHRSRSDWIEIIITFRYALWLVLIFLIGTVYSIQDMLNKQIKRHEKVMEEKLQTELQLLKAQINPHFLFNALNNIYSLAYMKSEKAPESVLKLSEMLRYVIEDCNDEKVPLLKEISYIENFIEFNKMKIPGKRNIKFSHEIQNADILIAPVVFIPFIENSFKYSRMEEDKNGFVDIILNEAEGKVSFMAGNSVFSQRTILPGSGKGLSNVKQRLGIIYPGRHNLSIDESSESYTVKLEIDLA